MRDPEQWQLPDGATLEQVQVFGIGFGSTQIGCKNILKAIEACGFQDSLLTVVNEFDCIPGILNLAQSAALVTKTTTRVWTLTKSTKCLLKFILPFRTTAVLQVGKAYQALVNSPYVIMLLTAMDRLIRRVQKEMQFDFRYG